jgi:hypothetical protein
MKEPAARVKQQRKRVVGQFAKRFPGERVGMACCRHTEKDWHGTDESENTAA